MASKAPPPVRSVIAVAAGVFVGGIATYGVEAISLVAVELLKTAMPALPATPLLPTLVAYLVGPTLGAALAARMAPSSAFVHAALVGAFFLAGGLRNFMVVPHPVWFVVASSLAWLAAPYLGTRLAGK